MTLHLEGKDYDYEYPLLTNVAGEDCLDVRNLVGERRERVVTWLVAAGMKAEALQLLHEQLKMYSDMRDECYDAGRYWWADEDTAATHDEADRQAAVVWAEMERLQQQT